MHSRSSKGLTARHMRRCPLSAGMDPGEKTRPLAHPKTQSTQDKCATAGAQRQSDASIPAGACWCRASVWSQAPSPLSCANGLLHVLHQLWREGVGELGQGAQGALTSAERLHAEACRGASQVARFKADQRPRTLLCNGLLNVCAETTAVPHPLGVPRCAAGIQVLSETIQDSTSVLSSCHQAPLQGVQMLRPGATSGRRASPRKATMASRPCLSSASFSLKVRASSPPDVRPSGSK